MSARNRTLHVGCSPLTGTIYAGSILKDGMTWASNKSDVTLEALWAVASKIKDGGVVTIQRDGVSYQIEVRRHKSNGDAS